MTVYCYDTEFLEDGTTIALISIGIVSDDGREYYAVNDEMPYERIRTYPWLCENVVPHLPLRGKVGRHAAGRREHYWSLDTSSVLVKPLQVIRNEVREFLTASDTPELWAYYGAYAHVALAQLFGAMVNRRPESRMYTNELMQELRRHGLAADGVIDPSLARGPDDEHHALADARWNLTALQTCRQAEQKGQR